MGSPRRLHLDYETFSRSDLKKVGASRYSKDPSTELLMAAYQFDEEPMRQWIPAEGQDMPADLEDGLQDPAIQKWAWNTNFEVAITRNTLGMDVDIRQWRDTMVLALYCSLPGKLEKAGQVVDLPDDKKKMSRGATLMRKFSFPRKPTKTNDATRVFWYDALADWEEYLLYNRTDVDAEHAIYKRLRAYDLPPEEWENWHIDHEINQAGLPFNMRMVRNAIRVYEQSLLIGQNRMNEITGLENANSLPQLLPWLRDQGYPFEDCKAAHIKMAARQIDDAVTGGMMHPEEVKDLFEVLQLRQEVSRTSIKKFHALARAVEDDGHLRFTLQFYGAQRTGRWAGRIYQPQNLPRPEKALEKGIEVHAKNVEFLNRKAIELIYPNTFDLLASTIRPAAQAPEGYMLIDADLNAIENRVLGWLARCKKILNVFEEGRDPYLDFASYLYRRPYEELKAEYDAGDSSARTIGKPGVLGCGYMLGAGAAFENKQTGEIEATGLLGYAWNMGVKQFTQEQSELSVQTFRREFEEVKDYWYDLERAMRQCIRTGKPQEHDRLRFDRKGPFLRMILPNGRALHYCRPKIESIRAPWGEKKPTITYEGLNDRKQWVRISTHPGKVTENADQAISRDLLMHGIRIARRRGIDIRLHVHDQIVGLAREDDAERQLKVLVDSMEERPWWAQDLPLGSKGQITKVFQKD